MSHHVIHILSHGANLRLSLGQLTCRGADGTCRSIPVEDLRAVVIAARGVSISADALAAVLDADAAVLHCSATYKPCGLSLPLPRTADHDVLRGQVRPRNGLNARLWRKILLSKTLNQAACLRALDAPSRYLEVAAGRRDLHEGNCARRYWRKFFGAIGSGGLRRRCPEDQTGINSMLNYGYAVMSSLCHRSLIVHGLLPQLGLHHRSRYRAVPLLHDFVEPFRPFVDWLLACQVKDRGPEMEPWARLIGTALRDHRVTRGSAKIKLMDAMDKAASSLARSYAGADAGLLWFPDFQT